MIGHSEPLDREDESQQRHLALESVRSGIWLLSRRVSITVIRLGAVAVLARHLSPAEFGLVALAQILLQFVTLGGETGIAVYVIQDREDGWRKRASEAFWLNLAWTIGLLGVAGLVVQPIAARFGPPGIVPLLGCLAAAFFFRQLAAVPEALVRRELKFSALVVRDTITDVITAGVSVFLALRGWGVWSLVLPLLVAEPLRLALIFRIAHWCPARFAVPASWKRISTFCAHSIGNQVLTLVSNDADTLLVGRLFGPSALGIYNMAWQASNLVGRNISATVTTISTSSLAILKESTTRLRAGYMRTLAVLAATGFPILAFIFVCADDLIVTVYGSQWLESVPFLRLFILFAIVRVISAPAGALCNAIGRPDVNFRFAAWFAPVYLLAIVAGSSYGLLGVCVAVVGVRTGGAIVFLWWTSKLIGLNGTALLDYLGRPLLATISLTMIAWTLASWIEPLNESAVMRLVMAGVVFAALYPVILLCIDRRSGRELLSVLGCLAPFGRRTTTDSPLAVSTITKAPLHLR